MVKVDAAVSDASGRAIPDLTAADFEVYDERALQKVVYFDQESDPLDLLLLLDVSGSMHRWLAELAGTARAALKPLGARDRVALMLFARDSAIRQSFTSDFASVETILRRALEDTEDVGTGTAINAAILSASGYSNREPSSARRAILIVTDNLSLNYRIPDEEVIRALFSADATLNAILIGKQRRPDPPRLGIALNRDFTPSDVFKLAEQTGGEAVESRKASDSFASMIERIRSRYRLEYEAPAAGPGEFRHIQVHLAPSTAKRHPHAVIRARLGYYAIQ